MSRPISESRSETAFGDFKLPLAPGEAVAEAERCLFCHDAPCIAACPTAIDIPQFIRKIATGNLHGSARTIFESNILGMSCARVCPVEVLCVGDCVYNHLDQPPIAIGRLQRHATDEAFAQGWTYFSAGPDSGRRVALIGGGPASLAAAHRLRRCGHACTIFEARPSLGGLNTTGVAPYKMRADRAADEIDWVLAIGGIEVRTGVRVGEAVSLSDLERDFDAVFVGVGLGADSPLGIPGEDLENVCGATAWIEQMKIGRVDLAGVERAVVVGGGNTAIDCVREALGLGIPRVIMAYRGDRARMSGYAHEWDAALAEGALAEWRAIPIAYEGSGRVRKVRCIRLDEARRPIAGSEFELEADLVLVAIGQSKLAAMLAGLEGIQVEGGRVAVDAEGFAGRTKWYAGGDCVNGGKEVVNAVAEGDRAAKAIDAMLRGAAKGSTHA